MRLAMTSSSMAVLRSANGPSKYLFFTRPAPDQVRGSRPPSRGASVTRTVIFVFVLQYKAHRAERAQFMRINDDAALLDAEVIAHAL